MKKMFILLLTLGSFSALAQEQLSLSYSKEASEYSYSSPIAKYAGDYEARAKCDIHVETSGQTLFLTIDEPGCSFLGTYPPVDLHGYTDIYDCDYSTMECVILQSSVYPGWIENKLMLLDDGNIVTVRKYSSQHSPSISKYQKKILY